MKSVHDISESPFAVTYPTIKLIRLRQMPALQGVLSGAYSSTSGKLAENVALNVVGGSGTRGQQ